jgi:hypothetical protein
MGSDGLFPPNTDQGLSAVEHPECTGERDAGPIHLLVIKDRGRDLWLWR